MSFKSYFLVGGAGFLGSHFIDALMRQKHIEKVTVYDNFSMGKEWHYQQHLNDKRLSIIKADVKDLDALTQAMQHHDVVMHFASNSDISQAALTPGIDFTEGIYLTFHVLEAARVTNVKRILYMSGSGVYGDVKDLESHEEQGSLYPISPYGASKLGGEAFVSSYCHMFGLTACVFRFGNVVGPRQTHGIGFDLVRNLFKNTATLRILGDGTQSKSYIYADDVVAAVLLANEKLKSLFEVYNVATGDYITVREIAEIIVACMGLENETRFEFSGGDRGWNGDVPIVRLNTDKIRALGWQCKRNSAQAIKESVLAIINQVKSENIALDKVF